MSKDAVTLRKALRKIRGPMTCIIFASVSLGIAIAGVDALSVTRPLGGAKVELISWEQVSAQPNRLVVDVRSAMKYSGGHFPSASLFTGSRNEAIIEQLAHRWGTTPWIIIYGDEGPTVTEWKNAAAIAENIGISQIYLVDGGWSAYRAKMK